MTDVKKTGLERLLEPFAANEINVLPKPYKKENPKGRCTDPRCLGFHGLPAAHLDYVGHAALTKRLLEADLRWTWEPMGVDANGSPILDANGGLWIRLTVDGVSRPGYGDSQGKTGPNAVKEAIGDALRNAGMRFGAALELWHKGDLYEAAEERGNDEIDKGEDFAVDGGKGKPKLDNTPPASRTYSDEMIALATDAMNVIGSYDDLDLLKTFYDSKEELWNVPVGKTTFQIEVTKRVKALKANVPPVK